jgi:hypothetical protein
MARKFFIVLSSGEQFRISELDFNHLENRQATGRTNGFYKQRGESFDRHQWTIAFKDIATWYSDAPERKNTRPPEVIDIEKRKPKPVGKPPAKKKETCDHDWNDSSTWTHVTNIVGGVNRYYKQCNKCGSKSPLVKKREVELAQEAKGLTIDEVPLVE